MPFTGYCRYWFILLDNLELNSFSLNKVENNSFPQISLNVIYIYLYVALYLYPSPWLIRVKQVAFTKEIHPMRAGSKCFPCCSPTQELGISARWYQLRSVSSSMHGVFTGSTHYLVSSHHLSKLIDGNAPLFHYLVKVAVINTCV